MRSIGRYAVLGLLGRGGMGAVFKAAMPGTGRVVAVKLLLPAEQLAATADMAELRRGFYREARLMASIRHPGVAQVLDVDEDASGRPFFVMEYYCNNLGAQLGEGPRVEEPCRRLGVEQALLVARQLAAALARLHHEGILHRDVKPFNLMLAERPGLGAGEDFEGGCPLDEVKLIDFGLSRLRGEREAGRPRGAVVGSPYYAAPEQEADPARADERADVFSAGVTLFRCLTGRLPQEGRSASSLRAGLDASFDAFFERCCHADPARRPASARALLAALDELAAHWARLRQAACSLPLEGLPSEPRGPASETSTPGAAVQHAPGSGLPGSETPEPHGLGLRPAGAAGPEGAGRASEPPQFTGPESGGQKSGVAEVVGEEGAGPEGAGRAACASQGPAPAAWAQAAALRSRPMRQPLRGARERFGLDALWRPVACLPERFVPLDGAALRDTRSGRVWERGGSPYALTLAGARAYASRLNAEGFAGRRGWRLPTVDELATLLLPEPDLRQLCLPGLFSPVQRRLWSADAKSFMAGWYVDAEHGFVWWQDATCEFHVRCVTSEEPATGV